MFLSEELNHQALVMDSAVRKIITFYQILDSLRCHRQLTRDSIDVALRWADYCEKFCRESQEKSFIPKFIDIIADKLAAKALNSSVLPTFDRLRNSKSLVIMAVLKNSFVSKDLFSYAVSLASSTDGLDEFMAEDIVSSSGSWALIRMEDRSWLEESVVSQLLVDSMVQKSSARLSREHQPFSMPKLADVMKDKTGPDFIVNLLLQMNSDEFLDSLQKPDEGAIAVERLTQFLTASLLLSFENDANSIFQVIGVDAFHKLCARDDRFVVPYSVYLETLSSSASDVERNDALKRLDSLKSALADYPKFGHQMEALEITIRRNTGET